MEIKIEDLTRDHLVYCAAVVPKFNGKRLASISTSFSHSGNQYEYTTHDIEVVVTQPGEAGVAQARAKLRELGCNSSPAHS